MAKVSGKDLKFNFPFFSHKNLIELSNIFVNKYREITFNKSKPEMANNNPFPPYSDRGSKWVTMNVKKGFQEKAPKGGYSYKQAKEGNMLRRLDSGWAKSKAPYVSGDLWRDLTPSTNPKKNTFSMGWNSYADRIQHLNDIGRILTSPINPVNSKVIVNMMPTISRIANDIIDSGQKNITIGKKK